MKLTRHASLRMAERGISQAEVVQALQHGRVVQRKAHETTGRPIAVVDHDIRGFRLRVVVDTSVMEILSVVYKTPTGRAE